MITKLHVAHTDHQHHPHDPASAALKYCPMCVILFEPDLIRDFIARNNVAKRDRWDDIFQDTAVQATKANKTYDTWNESVCVCCGIAKNVSCRNHAQHIRGPTITSALPEVADHRSSPSEECEHRELETSYEDTITSKLAPDELTLLDLRFFQRLSSERIAKELECTVGAVNQRVRRLRHKLFDIVARIPGFFDTKN